MSKRGFVSALFLGYLMFTMTILGVIEVQLQNKIQVYLNMKEANLTLGIEIKIIDWIKCEMKNNRLKEGNYSIDSVYFDVTLSDDTIYINVEHDKLKRLEYSKSLFPTDSGCETMIDINN